MRLGKRTACLVREAAVMGYVQGRVLGATSGDPVPPDSVIVASVLRSAQRNPDLYPTLSKIDSVDEAADAAEATMNAETAWFLRQFTEERDR